MIGPLLQIITLSSVLALSFVGKYDTGPTTNRRRTVASDSLPVALVPWSWGSQSAGNGSYVGQPRPEHDKLVIQSIAFREKGLAEMPTLCPCTTRRGVGIHDLNHALLQIS